MIQVPKNYTILMGEAHDFLYGEKEDGKNFLSFNKEIVEELRNWGFDEREQEIFELGIYYVLAMNRMLADTAINN